MNIHKRASTILLILSFCFTFSNALFAQSPGELKIEQLIRVDPQPFMTQGKLSHGYFVFRCKIQNLDTKPHKVTLSCDNVATKSFELQAKETINASLSLPVTSSHFGSDVQVHADNRKIYAVSCLMHQATGSYPSHYRSRFVTYAPVDNSVNNAILICRSLRKRFAEVDCIFAEKDCKFWPQDRMDYSSLDYILLTPEELAAAPTGVQTALKQFVLSGGILWFFECETQKESLDKIDWIAQRLKETPPKEADDYQNHAVLQYQIGFGVVALTDESAIEKFYVRHAPSNDVSDKETFNWLYNEFDFRPSWYEKENVNELQKWFPVVNDLSIPILGIGIVIFIFVILAGPINLSILSKQNKRIWLLVTVPVLSFLFAGAILLYVILSDGFQTEVRIASMSVLDQQSGMHSSMCQYGVYARTSPRNVVFDSDDELNISSNNEDDVLSIDWTSGKQVIPSHFATVRKPAYYKIRKTGTTRLKLDFDFNASTPYVVNGLGKDVKQLFVRDAEGKLWRAEKIAAGQKVQLSPVNRQFLEKQNKEPLIGNCISTSRWKIDEFSFNSSEKADVLRPCSYIATFSSSGPFMNKGISYAKEKKSFTYLFGFF